MSTTAIFILALISLYFIFRVGKWVGGILKKAREASEAAQPLIKKYGKDKDDRTGS